MSLNILILKIPFLRVHIPPPTIKNVPILILVQQIHNTSWWITIAKIQEFQDWASSNHLLNLLPFPSLQFWMFLTHILIMNVQPWPEFSRGVGIKVLYCAEVQESYMCCLWQDLSLKRTVCKAHHVAKLWICKRITAGLLWWKKNLSSGPQKLYWENVQTIQITLKIPCVCMPRWSIIYSFVSLFLR